jgi:hypothetical protein
MNIMKVVDDNVNAFIERVSLTYKIPIHELTQLLSSDATECVSPMLVDTEKPTVVVSKPVVKKASKSPTGPIRKCPYLFGRGPNKGCVCNGDVRQLGREFCPKHTARENTGVKERKTPVIPETDDTVKSLRLNKKINKLWHRDSGLVFNSKEDLTVIKRLVDDELVKLSSEDIDTCIRIGFAYRLEEDVIPTHVVEEKMDLVEEEDVIPTHVVEKEIDLDEEEDVINEVVDLLKEVSIGDSDSDVDSDSDSDSELEEEE